MSDLIKPVTTSRAPAGRGVIHGRELPQIAGRPWWVNVVTLIVLAAAATVDVVTFHQVLLLALNETEEVLWAAVGGFVVVAIALSHYGGSQGRAAASARYVPAARLTMWLSIGAWALLGLMAFAFRLAVADPAAATDSSFVVDGVAKDGVPGAADHTQTLSALLFLALYLGTGLISGLTGFLRPDPAAKQWGRVVSKRTGVAKRRADSGWVLAGAQQLRRSIEEERRRQEAEQRRTEQQLDALAVRLKQTSRPLIHSLRGPAHGRAHPHDVPQAGDRDDPTLPLGDLPS